MSYDPAAVHRCSPIAYQMVDSITVRNFRSFNEARIDDCRRINILVGENGSGKTALLEALFLAAGVSPELSIRTRTWRGGFESARMSGSHEDIHQALWADLFHKFQTSKTAVVSLRGAGEENRSVTLTLYRRGRVRPVAPRRDKPGTPVTVISDPSPMEFKWKIQGSPDVTVKPKIEANNLVFPPIPDSYVRAVFFAANQTPPGLETASRFSYLSRTFREQDFIKAFSQLYKNIEGLSVELTAAAPMLFAKVSGLPEKIPLNLASGGMSKLAAILLAMPDQAGGIILVDEIENGFFHRRMPIIWKALLDFARLYECQLFVSTHSAECLEAAAALAEENPKEFSVIRTVLRNSETTITHFGGDKFAAAMEENMDIR